MAPPRIEKVDMTYHVNGDIWRWNFTVSDDNGNLLAQIGRQFSIFREPALDLHFRSSGDRI